MPTPAETAAFDGLHCHKVYREAVAQNWRCPCCQRSAHDLIRWTEIRGPSWRARYADEYGMGFTIGFANHHCHGHGRFLTTRICGDCNWADGAAKRKLKLAESWSFSVEEIAQFITVVPHSGKTTINYKRAQEIYDASQTG
jgi:hypothetical protein